MADDLHLPEDLVRELEGIAIRTTQGTYVKMDDLRRLIERRREAQEVEKETIPNPKNITEAREMAKRYLKEQGSLANPEPGRSIPANEKPSAVEGVKRS